MGNKKQIMLGIPDYITVETEEKKQVVVPCKSEVCMDDIVVKLEDDGEQENVYLTAQTSAVKYLKLRWNRKAPEKARVLGDAWERSYGDLEWRGICGGRVLPWYFLVSAQGKQYGYGVKVRPSAMCSWYMDTQGITLVLDVRCGCAGVLLNGRTLLAAEIVSMEMDGEDSFAAAVEFCKIMCTDPVLPKHPVYGSNNWYYAYGESSEEEILSDTDYVVELTKDTAYPPYMVIDDCWQELRTPEYIGGPWKKGNKKFPDMKRLAEKMKEKGVHTGIWIRFLLNQDECIPAEWRLSHNGCLDPSHPDALEYIRQDVKRICDWGYELIKHDFSTFDLFGRWGFEMDPAVTQGDWHFYDRTKTSAEVVKMLYEAIYQASREHDTLILGCNTIGHLGAGLMHMNRTGDDTSGFSWERTRRMGINTLAFRLPQNKIFYEVDADCVGVAGGIPWELNRQWADVIAQSGTSLFFSAKPGLLNEKQNEELHQILCVASAQKEHKIPADWQDTDCPEVWTDGNETRIYQWFDPTGSVQETRNEKFYVLIPV